MIYKTKWSTQIQSSCFGKGQILCGKKFSDLIKNKGTKKYIQTTATNAEEALAAKEADFDMLLCK